MWETPFDIAMLDAKEGVVIHCPYEYLAQELFKIFNSKGVGRNWVNKSNTNWEGHKTDTAYYVKNGTLLYGPTKHAEDNNPLYSKYIKCTFYGKQTEPDPIEEDEWSVLLRTE